VNLRSDRTVEPRTTCLSAFNLLKRSFSAGTLIGLLVTGLLMAGGAGAVKGQSALDGFDPNANDTIRVVVVQPDGKILIGGDFTSLSPNGGAAVTRHRIARLNIDGTLDSAFDPDANGEVDTIAMQPDGKILVGGLFNGANSIGGQTRNYIARLDASTGAADSFDPDADNAVRTIAVQPSDGKVLAGGLFTNIGGQPRNRIARLNAVFGAADMSFDPNANDVVRVITLQADGRILVGGQFNGATSIGGQTRNYIARLNASTGAADSFDPNANDVVRAIAVQADGNILAGGLFTTIGGQTRNRIARLTTGTGTADSFDSNANSEVLAIVVQGDGKILVGGQFSGANSIGGQARNYVARLDPIAGAADSFDPNASDVVRAVAEQSDRKILVAGVFNTLAPNAGAPVMRNRIARLETDGRLDRTLNLSLVGAGVPSVSATAVQPDGKILIGGNFTSVLGVTRNRIARLNADGTLDTAFNPNANSFVLTIAVQADGKILAGGLFTGIGGETRNHIARLDAVTGAADSFDPNANDDVYTIVVQPDGKILVGGLFNHHGTPSIGGKLRNCIARLDPVTGMGDSFDPNAFNTNQFNPADVQAIAVQDDGQILVGGHFQFIGGETRNYIARLDATSGAADLFNPTASATVHAIALQKDGKILVGGDFSGAFSIGGQTRNFMARLNGLSGLADSFDPNANGGVFSIALQSDGKKVVGGNFTTINGVPRNHIARLDGTTGLADGFNPNADSIVLAIAVQTDGKILAGGDFSTIGGQSRSLFARLTNDTAALQNLAVTQHSVTWTRDGSSPQFYRVDFEYSNDNVSYTSLGSGTAAGNDWTRTGLNLTTGFNFYIRARGYYRSGEHNGSDSIAESVRNAFTAGPTAASSTVSGRILAKDNIPIAGVVVNLFGSQTRKKITDANGDYRFDNVETGGFYTLTASRSNYSFSPASRSFSLLGNTSEASFTGTSTSVIIGNSIDTPEYFVRQHYLDFLDREPDEAGFNFWSDQMLECGADDGCLERRRINVSAAYFLSVEFQQTGGLVDGLYRASYGVRPQFAEFMPDTRTIAENVVVGRTGWELQLSLNKQAFVDAFVQRPAFRSAYDNLANDAYVDVLIAHTRVAFTESERNALVSDLAGNRLTRAAVLLRIAADDRFVTAKRNEAFVMMEYFGYLRRDPDESGYAFWLNKLSEFNGDFERAEMVKAFLISSEYRGRFAHE
jgi:uncharacterized delta-60 repeat protein